MKKYINWIKITLVIVMVLVADLVTKHFLFSVEYFNLIPGVISVASNGGNTGAAWGIFSGKTLMLIIVSIIMIIALFFFNHFMNRKNNFYCIGFGFIIGGALGNLVDRIALQYVRDFIYLDFWPSFPTFNLADSFLCIGAVMMGIFIIFMSGEKNEK